jgi:cell division protein FtsW (lipid II flippase)
MKRFLAQKTPNQIQSRLLGMAGFFLFLFSVNLTLAPAVRARTWAVDYSWNHWIGFLAWVIIFTLVHRISRQRLPDADPYLLPIAALLTGWGILTIYRLIPGFGLRQTVWLMVCGFIFLLGLRLSPDLQFLRRYKYVLLSSGLLFTALTLLFGTNPTGIGLRLWLGCCGIYLQPSEPLKLLLIVFMAAYLADRLPLSLRPLPLLAPTAVVMGIALLLLVIQRDLGTASIFIYLYTIILFTASGKKRILVLSLAGFAIAGVAGYFLFDVIRLRVDAWFNPWLDPSGRSYQIVQSLMAVANGGTIGRGPGLGSPGLVPVAISDFVFTSISEETGLAGTMGLLALIGFFTTRGILTAMRAPNTFQRILVAGLSAYFGGQSILIIGGNIRLLPLTGVTLPFVSYGGSSLLTSFLALLLIVLISSRVEEEPAPLINPQPYLILAGLIILGLFGLSVTNAWWSIWRGPVLLERTDNVRRSISDRYIKRGALLDRHEVPINITLGEVGNYVRVYQYPELGAVTGYTNPNYGQSGLEASLDPYLRGLQGNPASTIWWDHMVYGQPPPGLNVRLSLDLEIQHQADELLGNHPGAIVLINATSGEILAMASHPTYDPNALDTLASSLFQDPGSPFLNRATQGLYAPGNALQPFFRAAGYPTEPDQQIIEAWYSALGFYSTPEIHLTVAAASTAGTLLRISPLQMVLAAATLSNEGVRPAPRLAMALATPIQGWIVLPALSEPKTVFSAISVAEITRSLMVSTKPFWQWNALTSLNPQTVTWSLGGTLPSWQGPPLVVVVLLEENDPNLAGWMGQTLLEIGTQP